MHIILLHINILYLLLTYKAGRALAVEPVHPVVACGPVEAREELAVVHVDLAVLSRIPGGTEALVSIDLVLARTPIQAGLRFALVDFQFAVNAWVEYE